MLFNSIKSEYFKIFFKKVLTSIKKHGILMKLSNEAVKSKRKSSKKLKNF